MFLLPGIIFIVIGMVDFIKKKQKKERCNYKITAQVIDGANLNRGESTLSFAVYAYEYLGKTYYVNSRMGMMGLSLIGGEEDIYINPNAPGECFIEGQYELLRAGALIGTGCINLLIGIMFMLSI